MHVAVTAVGVDRPGIVAAVAEALAATGSNIEDSRSAILGGHFAMVLIVDLPEGSDATTLEQALAAPANELGLGITVRTVAEARAIAPVGSEYLVSVYGADRPGIVASVARTLARHDVNIGDLATHVIGGEPPVYVMVLEVVVPPTADAAAVREALRGIATELEVEISMHENEPDTL